MATKGAVDDRWWRELECSWLGWGKRWQVQRTDPAEGCKVTRRDKKRGGEYSVKEAIEAIDQAFHRCTGFDPYDGSKINPKLLGV